MSVETFGPTETRRQSLRPEVTLVGFPEFMQLDATDDQLNMALTDLDPVIAAAAVTRRISDTRESLTLATDEGIIEVSGVLAADKQNLTDRIAAIEGDADAKTRELEEIAREIQAKIVALEDQRGQIESEISRVDKEAEIVTTPIRLDLLRLHELQQHLATITSRDLDLFTEREALEAAAQHERNELNNLTNQRNAETRKKEQTEHALFEKYRQLRQAEADYATAQQKMDRYRSGKYKAHAAIHASTIDEISNSEALGDVDRVLTDFEGSLSHPSIQLSPEYKALEATLHECAEALSVVRGEYDEIESSQREIMFKIHELDEQIAAHVAVVVELDSRREAAIAKYQLEVGEPGREVRSDIEAFVREISHVYEIGNIPDVFVAEAVTSDVKLSNVPEGKSDTTEPTNQLRTYAIGHAAVSRPVEQVTKVA